MRTTFGAMGGSNCTRRHCRQLTAPARGLSAASACHLIFSPSQAVLSNTRLPAAPSRRCMSCRLAWWKAGERGLKEARQTGLAIFTLFWRPHGRAGPRVRPGGLLLSRDGLMLVHPAPAGRLARLLELDTHVGPSIASHSHPFAPCFELHACMQLCAHLQPLFTFVTPCRPVPLSGY